MTSAASLLRRLNPFHQTETPPLRTVRTSSGPNEFAYRIGDNLNRATSPRSQGEEYIAETFKLANHRVAALRALQIEGEPWKGWREFEV